MKEGRKHKNMSHIDFSFNIVDENDAKVSRKTNATRNASMGVGGIFNTTEGGVKTPTY